MGRDELGDCCKIDLLFLRSGDDDIWVWGVCSSFTSKFEVGVWGFIFVGGSVKWSPTASVLGSLFVKDTESVSDRGWSFDY